MLFVVLIGFYAPAASWSLPANSDVLTNVVTAERLASTGSPILPAAFESWTIPPLFGTVAYVVDSPRGPVSQYPPGAAIWGAIFYLAAPGDEPIATMLAAEKDPAVTTTVPLPPVWPATLAAVLAAAAASVFLLWSVWNHLGSRAALTGALLFGLGTSAWGIAADGLWQHSVTIAAIAMAGAAMARSPVTAGLAYGFAVLTRPLTALFAVVSGFGASLSARSWRPLAGVGVPAAAGLGLVLAYNHWAFGIMSVTGGYGEGVGSPDSGLGWVVANVLQGLIGPPVGLFLWSPMLAVALVGVPAVWRATPAWMRSAALGGAVYLIVHLVIHRAFPDILPYRYPLEAVFAAAPLLLSGLLSMWRRGGTARTAAVLMGAVSVGLQLFTAFFNGVL